MSVTYHVVIAFDRDAEGDLKPGEAREVLSPIVAERRARALALEHAGALAFSCTGDPTTGEFQDGVILAQFGEVDLDSLGESRGGVISRTAIADPGVISDFAFTSRPGCGASSCASLRRVGCLIDDRA